MEHKQYSALSILKIIKIIFASAFVLWMILGVPTGWLYDLGIGRGTEQGQLPDQSVQTVHTQDEVEDFFFQNTPATVSKNDLIQCPLWHLRDERYEGEHTSSRRGAKHTVVITEYSSSPYPIDLKGKLFSRFFGVSTYNGYYLAPLEDGSYVCVYFDDYHLLRSGEELPTGYVRRADAEEKNMLHRMAEDYEVDPMYVLDMYRHGKVSWMLDFAIRAFTTILVLVAVMSVREKWRRNKGQN